MKIEKVATERLKTIYREKKKVLNSFFFKVLNSYALNYPAFEYVKQKLTNYTGRFLNRSSQREIENDHNHSNILIKCTYALG